MGKRGVRACFLRTLNYFATPQTSINSLGKDGGRGQKSWQESETFLFNFPPYVLYVQHEIAEVRRKCGWKGGGEGGETLKDSPIFPFSPIISQ